MSILKTMGQNKKFVMVHSEKTKDPFVGFIVGCDDEFLVLSSSKEGLVEPFYVVPRCDIFAIVGVKKEMLEKKSENSAESEPQKIENDQQETYIEQQGGDVENISDEPNDNVELTNNLSVPAYMHSNPFIESKGKNASFGIEEIDFDDNKNDDLRNEDLTKQLEEMRQQWREEYKNKMKKVLVDIKKGNK